MCPSFSLELELTSRFDGDGMLHGVLFPKDPSSPPTYTNRHLATPMLSLALILLRSPVPSIALLISPLSSLHRLAKALTEAVFLLIRARMGVLSVANTAVVWWGQGMGSEAAEEIRAEVAAEKLEAEKAGGSRPNLRRRLTNKGMGYKRDHRLLATCESGPPLEVRVPELETVRWDRLEDTKGENLNTKRGKMGWMSRLGLSAVSEVSYPVSVM
jgi:hypothetical protein